MIKQKILILGSAKDNLLTFKGKFFNSVYRVYIDSTENDTLPKICKPKDYILGAVAKDVWYEHLVQGLELDITKYAQNKTEFLKKYKAITTSYIYMYNFWNTWHGWTYPDGKSAPNNVDSYTFSLTDQNHDAIILNESDAAHSNNEQGRLRIKQTWKGNILNVNLFIGVWYHWQACSVVDHASLGIVMNDLYTLVSVPNDDSNYTNVKSDTIVTNGEFTSSSSSEINLNNLDQKLINKAQENEIKNSWFKTSTLMSIRFYGEKKIDNTTYVFSGILRFIENPLLNIDNSLLLNGGLFTRTMKSTITNSFLRFYYQNSYDGKEIINSVFVPDQFQNISAPATIKVPFIFVN